MTSATMYFDEFASGASMNINDDDNALNTKNDKTPSSASIDINVKTPFQACSDNCFYCDLCYCKEGQHSQKPLSSQLKVFENEQKLLQKQPSLSLLSSSSVTKYSQNDANVYSVAENNVEELCVVGDSRSAPHGIEDNLQRRDDGVRVFEIKNVRFAVNFTLKQVFAHAYKGNSINVHVVSHRDVCVAPSAVHVYPGVLSQFKLPELKAASCVQVVRFNANNEMYVSVERLDTKLYYVHHHRNNDYVYGLVPAIRCVSFENARTAFLGAPIFDSRNNLVSFVTNHYMDVYHDGGCVLPVVGKSSRLFSSMRITGAVQVRYEDNNRLELPTSALSGAHTTATKNEIKIAQKQLQKQQQQLVDLNVSVRRKRINLFLIHNGRVLMHTNIKSLFAGSMLYC
ncbi:p26b [Lambdina fiscellaria nucleopolyhedrovirus]|uniref:p26b n=1 Tax=Lambdina fiscellaria nucleopolyhedrovirus TaxID=1642929 RepID=A0A0E3URR5_9ABAC|nr:p26b [Lambdina fiscellaria nucleopolyhedrovirus]AKC91704.1 p26b [Lambdina fiscellaria nucleopolyhedrovirus]